MSDSPETSATPRESGAAVRVPAPPLLFAAPLAATLALLDVGHHQVQALYQPGAISS